MAAPINIVIVGSNFAGNSISHYVLKHITPASTSRPVKVTVIAPSTKLYWTVGVPRAILNKPELIKSEAVFGDMIPHLTSQHGPRGEKWEFLEAWARGVDTNNKTVSIEPVDHNVKQTTIPYDHLIIATGTRNHNPFQTPKSSSREDQLAILAPLKPFGTTEESLTAIKSWAEKIAAAPTIVLVGGGPTGVETASEIKDNYPGKKVILITSGEVLPMLQPRISLTAKKMLEKIGVETRLHTKVTAVNTSPSGTGVEVVLSTGETVQADLFIPTLGQKPNTEFLPKDLLDNNGHVITTPYFNSPTYPNIWALGDVTHWEGNRKAMTIEGQAPVLTWNLRKVVLEGDGTAVGTGAGWSVYKHSTSQRMFVPIGKKQGVGQFDQWKVWSFFVWMFKCRDYMIGWMGKSYDGSAVEKVLKPSV